MNLKELIARADKIGMKESELNEVLESLVDRGIFNSSIEEDGSINFSLTQVGRAIDDMNNGPEPDSFN